jgi:hypothetical protein
MGCLMGLAAQDVNHGVSNLNLFFSQWNTGLDAHAIGRQCSPKQLP